MIKSLAYLVSVVVVSCGSGFAQQEKGDKEVGIGGQLLFTHSSNFTGNADLQASFGYYVSVRNYFGFEADPSLTFSHSPAQPGFSFNTKTGAVTSCTAGSAGCEGGSAAMNSTDVGGFFGANYRRLVGNPKGKVFPFIGGGGGAYVQGGSSGNSVSGALYGEIGLKSYLSQKTSLEFAYKLLYTPQSGGTFQTETFSLITISLRHIF
jgi:hypothetical protein